ncbi:MAG TPA: amidohydrolase, partial [Bradyrhizobium sp.]
TFAPSMAALMKLVPVSQISYGTDYPYFGFDQFAELRKLGLSAADLDAIGHENAAQLIPRLRA